MATRGVGATLRDERAGAALLGSARERRGALPLDGAGALVRTCSRARARLRGRPHRRTGGGGVRCARSMGAAAGEELLVRLAAAEKAVEAGESKRAEDALMLLSKSTPAAKWLASTKAAHRVKALKRHSRSTPAVRGACVKVVDAWRAAVTAEAASAKEAKAGAAKSNKSAPVASAAAADKYTSDRLRVLEQVYTNRNNGGFRDAMTKVLKSKLCKSESDYKVGDTVRVVDRMQRGTYSYKLSAPIGQDFAPGFEPLYSPAEMLALGVFEGKYYNDGLFELPREWFEGAIAARKLGRTPSVTHNAMKVRARCALRAHLTGASKVCALTSLLVRFQAKSRQPLHVWNENGWLHKDDPRGWFQWYCRYYLGRRCPKEDARQIGRWRSFGPRHSGQIRANCKPGDCTCRPRQRQGLLQWSYEYDL